MNSEEKNENKYKEFYDKNEFNEIGKIIIKNGFQNDLDENKYKAFKYIFKTKKKNFLVMNELNLITDTLINSMNTSLNEFFDWNKVMELIESFKKTINIILGNDKEAEKYITLCNNLLLSFKKELEDNLVLKKINIDINIINKLKNIVYSLNTLNPENKSLIQLKENYISLSYFIYNCRKIRIPFL